MRINKRLMWTLLVLNIGITHAATIFTSGPPDQVDGIDISDFVGANNFLLNTPSLISGGTFFSSANVDPFESQFSGTISWGIFQNMQGQPGGLIASGSDADPMLLDTGQSILGTEEYAISFMISNLYLGPGAYWLGLHEGIWQSQSDSTPIYWDTTAQQTDVSSQVTTDLSAATGWTNALSDTDANLAFQLSGQSDVQPVSAEPEPGGFSLSCLGFVGIFLLFKRGRRNIHDRQRAKGLKIWSFLGSAT